MASARRPSCRRYLRTVLTKVEIYGPHEAADSDFTNVPGHVANPENPAVFDGPVAHAKEHGHELVMASDPDCDRLGVAAPKTKNLAVRGEPLPVIRSARCSVSTSSRRARNSARSRRSLRCENIVTTELVRKIATSYNVRTEGDLQVGFKYIAETMDRVGPDKFVFAAKNRTVTWSGSTHATKTRPSRRCSWPNMRRCSSLRVKRYSTRLSRSIGSMGITSRSSCH